MTPFYADPLVTLYLGDCLDVMRELPDASVDAVVTDPPYGLEFMGKEWDSLRSHIGNPNMKPREQHIDAEWNGTNSQVKPGAPKRVPWCRRCGKFKFAPGPSKCHCREPQWNTRQDETGRQMQAWHERWATEAFRVLKPGGYLLAFGGTRTYHRLASAIEDAGFEIRDCLMHIYASGFPKSLDVSKALDKRRDDYEDVCAVALWLRPHVERTGFDVVTKAFGFKDETMARARWTSRSQPQVPTWEQWEKLRELCGFGDEMDAEVWRLNGRKGKPGEAWDQREKIGERDSGLDKGSGTTVSFDGSKGRNANGLLDITAPATDLARKWEGWGTALKPAHEPIVMARKPLVGSVAANVTRWGVGALNIDGTRIGTESTRRTSGDVSPDEYGSVRQRASSFAKAGEYGSESGRWPSNVLLSDAELFDEPNPYVVGSGQVIKGQVGMSKTEGGFRFIEGDTESVQQFDKGTEDSGGYSRFFIIPKADRAERERGLAGTERAFGQSGGAQAAMKRGEEYQGADSSTGLNRVKQRGNVHPTVKPIDLMRHLVRLVTPPGGTVLDPFLGSGTTALAASEEGFRCIGIEREAEYLEIAKGRLMATPMGLGLDVGAPVRKAPKTHPDLAKHQPKRRAAADNYSGGWTGTDEEPAA